MAMGRRGAILEFDLARFGGPTVAQEFHRSVALVPSKLVNHDPDRVMLMMTNLGPDILYFSTTTQPSALNGHMLGVGQVVVYRVQEDGSLVGEEQNGICATTTAEVHITTVRRGTVAH